MKFLAMTLMAGCGIACGQSLTNVSPNVITGQFGGLRMQVVASSAQVEARALCLIGVFNEPIEPDSQGEFRLEGTIPVFSSEPLLEGTAAELTGTVIDDTLRVRFRFRDLVGEFVDVDERPMIDVVRGMAPSWTGGSCVASRA